MNRLGLRWRARLAALGAAGALLVGLFPMAGTVLAAVTITPATGGSAISADTAGTATYATLTGPSIAGTERAISAPSR